MKGDYDISGEILFSIEYFEGKVLVNVKLARGLASADRNGKADPYVKTYLLPDPSKETKRKTRIVKKNLDPIFNEVLSVCFTSLWCCGLSSLPLICYTLFPVVPPVRASFSRCGQEDTLVECVGLGQVWKEQLSRRSPCSSVRAGPECEDGEVVASSGHGECVCVCVHVCVCV